MRMKSIVLIDHEPFTIRRKELFYVDKLRDFGFNVEIWDISQYVLPGLTLPGEIEDPYLSIIGSILDLKRLISSKKLEDTIFIVECWKGWHTKEIFKLLSDKKCLLVRIDLFGNTYVGETIRDKFVRLFSSMFWRVIRDKVISYAFFCYKKVYHIKDYDRVFASSIYVKRTDSINHPDYENFHFRSHPPLLDGQYIVFCDNYFPFHPDFKYRWNYNHMPSAEKYVESLNRFFSFIEAKYKMPVVIAAHPKSDYRKDYFGNRKIMKGVTDNLIINSSMVILHASNSISYAILANRPILMITTDGYNTLKIEKQRMEKLARRIKLPLYNIDKVDMNIVQANVLSSHIRVDYIYSFLTSYASCEVQNINYITSVFNKL